MHFSKPIDQQHQESTHITTTSSAIGHVPLCLGMTDNGAGCAHVRERGTWNISAGSSLFDVKSKTVL